MSGKMIGGGDQPLVCTPLVGKTRNLILKELDYILAKKPDIIEWRADFFEAITNTNEVVSLANLIATKTGDIPVIFTLRSSSEGGNFIPNYTAEEALSLIAAVCRNTNVEYVDYELSNLPQHIKMLRQIASETNTKIIASFHNFNLTPDREVLLQKFVEAKESGADVAKIAVMPQSLNDVLTLLGATLEAKSAIGIPIITVSMGTYGIAARLIGGVFGSAVTFAVGYGSSAPGQIPIEELQTVLNIVQKASGKTMS